MDQNLNNSQNEFLWKLLANPADEAHLYGFNLQRLVNDFPQSGLLQALLAHASDEKNLKQASVYFNAKALYKLINNPALFNDVPAEKIFVQNNIGFGKYNSYDDQQPFAESYIGEQHKHVAAETESPVEAAIVETPVHHEEQPVPVVDEAPESIEELAANEAHLAEPLTEQINDGAPLEHFKHENEQGHMLNAEVGDHTENLASTDLSTDENIAEAPHYQYESNNTVEENGAKAEQLLPELGSDETSVEESYSEDAKHHFESHTSVNEVETAADLLTEHNTAEIPVEEHGSAFTLPEHNLEENNSVEDHPVLESLATNENEQHAVEPEPIANQAVEEPSEHMPEEGHAGLNVSEEPIVAPVPRTLESLTLDERLERILNEARGIPNPPLITLQQAEAIPAATNPVKVETPEVLAATDAAIEERAVPAAEEITEEYPSLSEEQEAVITSSSEEYANQDAESSPQEIDTLPPEASEITATEEYITSPEAEKKTIEHADSEQSEEVNGSEETLKPAENAVVEEHVEHLNEDSDPHFNEQHHGNSETLSAEKEQTGKLQEVTEQVSVTAGAEHETTEISHPESEPKVETEDAQSVLPETESEIIREFSFGSEHSSEEEQAHVEEPVITKTNFVDERNQHPVGEEHTGSAASDYEVAAQVAHHEGVQTFAENEHEQEHIEPVIIEAEAPAHFADITEERPSEDIEDEIFDEIVSIEQIRFDAKAANPEDETDRLIRGSAVGSDYFMFDRTFGERMNTAKPLEAEPTETEPVIEIPVAEEAEKQDVSNYHDEKMPYSFMWWLNKTRKEHAGLYQPFAKKNDVAESIAKAKNTGDELQQQYYENIFHITSVDELDKSVPAPPKVFEFGVKRKSQAIIERFIEEEPTIKPQSSDKIDNENKAKKSSEDRDEMVTETLAAIYSDQMLYHKAISSYKKLMLKFPEKSRYFAGKIEQLEKKTS